MLREWATTSDRTENFLVTGERTGRGAWTAMMMRFFRCWSDLTLVSVKGTVTIGSWRVAVTFSLALV
jgi:hypothetical protein